jgi:4-hydroxy-tetrahydrodipicolinate reductase
MALYKVVVSGASGKMGQRIISFILEDKEMELSGAIEAPFHPSIGKLIHEGITIRSDKDIRELLKETDVLVEFTNPAATLSHLEACKDMGRGMVIGTTGLSEDEISRIKEASTFIPVVFSPNMSVGVNLLFDIVQRVSKALGREYEVEIIEAHHHHKKDAPSGTALRLGELIATTLGLNLEDIAVYGRKGMIGERKKEEMGFSVIRGGDIVGEHTVLFVTEGERIEITHRAHSRDTFARGAIRAAKFVVKASPGFYNMGDVLGLKG